MTSRPNLDAYFNRIGWSGATHATFDTLSDLVHAHMAAIPFENLDVLLGRAIRLDLEGIQNKLVRDRRGGYCFEHSTLLASVLERLGFHPVRHSARVTMASPLATAPRTHMFLTVPLHQGRFVVDAGFGSLAPSFPVPLLDGEHTRTEETTHWMTRERDLWVLRVKTDGKIVDAWVSTLEEDRPVDFDMANHYVSTYPTSPFVNRILMRALTRDGRVTVMNRDVTMRRGDQKLASELADRAALRVLVAEHFGFDLPEVESLRVPSLPEWT